MALRLTFLIAESVPRRPEYVSGASFNLLCDEKLLEEQTLLLFLRSRYCCTCFFNL